MTQHFSILGNNCFGLKAKKESLYQTLKAFDFPSCITLQETKMRKMGSVKINDYQVFEKLRPGLGGGLLTAISQSLSPVLISPIKEDTEILIVQCLVNDMKLRVINGYGPQDDAPLADRLGFWSSLEQEIIIAKDANCSVIVQLDANAKVGRSVIQSDPNVSTSENGKLLLNMVDRENMHILNCSPLCRGSITRQRITPKNEEKSILDYVITCDKMHQLLESMVIDDDQIFSLTKYASTKGRQKIIKSDHNIMYAKFSIQYQNLNSQRPRQEIFNLKNKECQEIFSEESENNVQLQKCFKSDKTFSSQCKTFLKSIDGLLHKCFRKVRVGKKIENSEIQKLLDEKLKIQKKIKLTLIKEERIVAQQEMVEIEQRISKLSSERNCEIVNNYTKSLGTLDGRFSQLGMWKLKNQLVPKDMDPPMAKQDKYGNLITTPEALKKLYLETYVDRLNHREIKPDMKNHYLKKMELWNMRFSHLKSQITDDWTTDELSKTLKTLKTNKSRDPSGLINEIFKPPVIGKDLEESLRQFINGIKREFYFPPEVLYSNITSIYKRKGSRLDMNNDRGIFGLSVFKKIIDKIIYIEKYPLLDENMSDSNIGARKKKNIKNHLFIVHGIINSVVQGNRGCVDIQIYDLVKAFDALWVEDCMNDLWDTLPAHARDDRLGLVYEACRTNLVAVNTAVGQTEG